LFEKSRQTFGLRDFFVGFAFGDFCTGFGGALTGVDG